MAVPLRNRLNADVRLGQTIPGTIPDFEEWEAATSAGLDMWRWENNQYPSSFRSKVIAWHRLHGSLEAHKLDASIPAKKSK